MEKTKRVNHLPFAIDYLLSTWRMLVESTWLTQVRCLPRPQGRVSHRFCRQYLRKWSMVCSVFTQFLLSLFRRGIDAFGDTFRPRFFEVMVFVFNLTDSLSVELPESDAQQ